jgi:L-iditol 2-dehydrogenase
MQINGYHNVVSCQGGDKTVLEQRPIPHAGAGEILLRLNVVGFCGTDLFKLNTGKANIGTVLGHELVGQVVFVGVGVEGFAINDRVAVTHHVPCGECTVCRRGNDTMCETFRENLMEPGGFADTILIRPRAVKFGAHILPDHVSDEAAVFVEPAACVIRSVYRSEITAEGTAIILGGGSMGLLHLLVLRAALPGVKVVVIDPLEARRELALELGAAGSASPGLEALSIARSITGGDGADAVFDTVGGNRTLQAGLELSRQGGSIVLFAHAGDGERANFDLNNLFKYERRILGTYSGAVKEQKDIFDLIKSGALDPTPLVTHSMPLDEFQIGVDLVRQHRALKVLFTPSRSNS